MTVFDPEQLDASLDGVEVYNRQLGGGRFSGQLFRASLGSATLDTGSYNNVATSSEGTSCNRVCFALELTSTGTMQLNGAQLQGAAVAVYQENVEFFNLLGEQSCSWLAFQVERKDMERAGYVLPGENFTMLRISRQRYKRLVGELLQLVAVMRSAEQSDVVIFDVERVKDHLISLFSLTLGSAAKAERLDNAECLRIALRITDYMEAHLDERIAMTDLCRLSGKSEWTLRRIFKRIYNISPQAYLNIHRLNAANRKLLQSTAKQTSVTNTAMNCGFLHLGRFSAEYKKHFGEYPSDTLVRE